jgi:hypothetical protein
LNKLSLSLKFEKHLRNDQIIAILFFKIRNITGLQQCVKRFARECLPRFARQVTNLVLFGVTKVNKPLCLNDANKLAFTKVAKCGNINIEPKHKCMDTFIDDLKETETEGKSKLRRN